MSSFSDEHATHYSSDAPGLVVTKTEHPVAQRPKNRSRFRNPRPRSFGDRCGSEPSTFICGQEKRGGGARSKSTAQGVLRVF